MTIAPVSSIPRQPVRPWVDLLSRLCARISGRREPASPTPTTSPQPIVSTPAGALSSRAHWDCVAAVVERATASAILAREAQLAARAQLEMAEYALDLLFEEVATVMPITQKVRSLRPLAAAAASAVTARPVAMAA